MKQVESQWLFGKPDKAHIPKSASQLSLEGLNVFSKKFMEAFYRFKFVKSSFFGEKIKFIFNKSENLIVYAILDRKRNLLSGFFLSGINDIDQSIGQWYGKTVCIFRPIIVNPVI